MDVLKLRIFSFSTGLTNGSNMVYIDSKFALISFSVCRIFVKFMWCEFDEFGLLQNFTILSYIF